MAKNSSGQTKTASTVLLNKRHSNISGKIEEGMLFLHVIGQGKKHMARYVTFSSGNARCSVCCKVVN